MCVSSGGVSPNKLHYRAANPGPPPRPLGYFVLGMVVGGPKEFPFCHLAEGRLLLKSLSLEVPGSSFAGTKKGSRVSPHLISAVEGVGSGSLYFRVPCLRAEAQQEGGTGVFALPSTNLLVARPHVFGIELRHRRQKLCAPSALAFGTKILSVPLPPHFFRYEVSKYFPKYVILPVGGF